MLETSRAKLVWNVSFLLGISAFQPSFGCGNRPVTTPEAQQIQASILVR
ncbi:MAG TPA: hypothetical protein PKD64_03360 [Pirellulaceae bacterium]|nr:hypothetical protein [Pirellulaceae bacterium]